MFCHLKKTIFQKYIFQLKNLSGIQKSHLEHRAIILKIRTARTTKKFGLPISIPNDPKIPKITLRTPCDQAKDAKNASTVKSRKKLIF